MAKTYATERLVLIGASGWLAHYLIPVLTRLNPDRELIALSSRSNATENVIHYIKEAGPATVLHLGRGETETDFDIHRRIIELQKLRMQRYLYVSSINAVDADLSRPHLELERGHARSDYGKFKARCETEVLTHCPRSTVIRFGALHGWAPNRIGRTEQFLRKMAGGEAVVVETRAIQNRAFVGELAEQLAQLIATPDAMGTFHLGTSDSSEESEFLKRLAAAFGYSTDGIAVTDSAPTENYVATLDRFPSMFPNFSIATEADTIQAVAAQPKLAKYRKS